MNKSLLYILPFVTLISTACVEDEGNYEYSPSNEISIEGLGTSYQVLSYIDTLKITPEITGSLSGDNTNDFEYDWHICTGIIGDVVHVHTFISDEKDLEWPVALKPGSYTVYFTVKEKSTGLETTVASSVSVTSSFSRGFLFLGEIEGSSDRIGLDMLTMAPGRDSVMVEGAFDSYFEGLSNPVKIFYSGYNFNNVFAYLMTEDETWGLSCSDDNIFQPTETFSAQGHVECEYEVKRPITMRNTFPNGCFSYNATLCQRARFYMCDDVILGGSAMVQPVYFVQPYNRYSAATGAQLFKFYPYMFFTFAGYFSAYSPSAYIYDSDSDCFASTNFYGCYSTKLTYPNTPWSFDLKSEGRKLYYGESGKESGLSYMIVKDNDGSKAYIYTIQFPSTGKALYEIDPAVAVDFDKASHYAFSYARRTLLYSVGNKVYNYDYTSNKANVTEFDGEVTYLSQEYDSSVNIYQYMIATWNNSTKKGKIAKYDVNVTPDDLALYPRENEEWETRLKVKDVAWFRK